MRTRTTRLGRPGRNGRDGANLDLEVGPSLAERLLAARERKGVDLFRAERDTKIRARYLAALEEGDYRQLPGTVYTKGFLRNYALYLGLDPEDLLDQFHRERGGQMASEPTIVVPRPITAPRQALTITPGVIAAVLMTLVVIAFGVYLGLQLFRFAKPPTVAITEPPIAVVEVDETTTDYVIRGTATPGASITIVTPGRDPIRGTADADGRWMFEVELRRGRNQFTVTATDPETGKQAEAASPIFITVPFSVVEAPTLTVDQPADGATFQNGAIPIQGIATNATTVTISATLLKAAVVATPRPTATPKGGKPTASPAGSAAPGPQPVTVTPAEDGTFAGQIELTAGEWEITVTAAGVAAKAVSLTRKVSVAYKGVTLVVTVKGGKAWLKVWVDGVVDAGIGGAGRVYSSGKTLSFTGERSVEVRTGASGETYFTLNGVSLGALGPSGMPQTWLFEPPNPPVQTQRR